MRVSDAVMFYILGSVGPMRVCEDRLYAFVCVCGGGEGVSEGE